MLSKSLFAVALALAPLSTGDAHDIYTDLRNSSGKVAITKAIADPPIIGRGASV